MKSIIWVVLVLVCAFPVRAETQKPSDNPDADDSGYTGCLGNDGFFYNMSAGPNQATKCEANDIPVFLGTSTIDHVEGGEGIDVLDLGNGIRVELDKSVTLPKSCSPGEKVVASPNGWECLRESAAGKPSQIWIQPLWQTFRQSSGGFPGVISSDTVIGGTLRVAEGELAFVNPSWTPTSVSCYFFSANGVLQLDFTRTVIVGGGEMASCRIATTPDSSELRGWSLLVADSGIWPSGQIHDFRIQGGDNAGKFRSERTLPLYRVDCDDQTGQEFVCQFAGQ